MFWAMEKFDPSNEFWSDDNTAIKKLLQSLADAIRESKLNYYFIPGINLMEAFMRAKGEDVYEW